MYQCFDMSQLKILIFDDELSGLGRLYLNLMELDFAVEITIDPAEIISRFKRLNPGVVVVNQDATGFNAVEICKVIKQESQVPIILLLDKNSASTIAIDGCKADEIIYKPVDLNELVFKIKELHAMNG